MLTLKRNGRELRKVMAIKAIRDVTNWGLRESKDVVDKLDTHYSKTTIAIGFMPSHTRHILYEAGVDVILGAASLENDLKDLIYKALNEEEYSLACSLIDVLAKHS